MAPHFVNAARILHVLKGSAQLEITFNDGKEALRTTVQAGDLIVVPAMMPLGMVSRPVTSFSFLEYGFLIVDSSLGSSSPLMMRWN